MWHNLLLACSLVSATIGQNSLNYVLLVPAEIHFPSTENVCVDISGARENVTVRVTLQQGVHDEVIFRHILTEYSLFKCVPFQAPCPNKRAEEVISIHISIVGPTTNLSEKKKMLVRLMGSFTLIQTDKPMYKPGENVNIRVLSFNREFMAVNDTCPLIGIQDPNKNQIAQWVDLIPNMGMISLSWKLDSDAMFGAYKISSLNAQEDFYVSEYTLPKFEPKVMLPPVVTILMRRFPLKICGRYTFGKAVHGEISAIVCRRAFCYYWMAHDCPHDLCTEYKGQTDRNGCFETVVETESYNLRSYFYEMKFEVKAFLVEAGTGVQGNATASCRISAMIAKVTFEETETSDSYYKPNLRYKTKLSLKDADGSPIKSETLYLKVEYNKVTDEFKYETDENGEACVTLNSKPWNGHTVYLKAYYKKNDQERIYSMLNPYYKEAVRALNPFTTITGSLLKIQPSDSVLTCDQEHSIEVDYIMRGSELAATHKNTLNVRYIVVARGNLVMNGEKEIKVNTDSVMMDTLELRLPVTASLAPTAHILVYALLDNRRIIADTEVFQVSKCFNNKVTQAFSEKEVTPGSETTLHVNAQPGSLCSVRSVDEGLLLLRPESEISSDAVAECPGRSEKLTAEEKRSDTGQGSYCAWTVTLYHIF